MAARGRPEERGTAFFRARDPLIAKSIRSRFEICPHIKEAFSNVEVAVLGCEVQSCKSSSKSVWPLNAIMAFVSYRWKMA